MTSAKNLCDFIDSSPTSFHAADNIAAHLFAHGANILDEAKSWALEPGVPYFVSRGGNSIIAFRLGTGRFGETGYALAGAHTDSPGLKVRSKGERLDHSIRRIAVDVYGGAILSSWLDRPLCLAGRALVREDGEAREFLFTTGKPIGIIPNIAIHLNREINKGFEYNAHQHLPVLVETLKAEPVEGGPSWVEAIVASELDIDPGKLAGVEAFFFDGQKAVIFGAHEGIDGGLVNAPRLDDLAGCQAILEAFCASKPGIGTQVACFLEAEEVGSMTAQGANSSFLRDILARAALASGSPYEDFYRATPRSLCLSMDLAQALNPAYADKYDETFSPLLGKGPALKVNVNQRYATDLRAEVLFAELCAEAGIPWQRYMAKADSQPGTTIGPISSSRLGLRTMDVGQPLLSMHAVRETLDAGDQEASVALVKAFYGRYGGL
ncbi:MAG: M18 family aminopeptidase [Spirochaetes bacterium]|nr:M18 family aminopeptidase [Spirochaetota bacterium]